MKIVFCVSSPNPFQRETVTIVKGLYMDHPGSQKGQDELTDALQ
jgi:hypothetical protein